MALQKSYDNFMEKTDGIDPDFPQLDFGNKGKKVSGTNAAHLDDQSKKQLDKIWQETTQGKKG